MPASGYSGSVSLSTHNKRKPRTWPIWELRFRTPEHPGGREKSLGRAWIDGDLWRHKGQVKHLRSRPAQGYLTQALAHTAAEAYMLEIQHAKPQERRTVHEACQAFVAQKRREQKNASTLAGYATYSRTLCARTWKHKSFGEQPLDSLTERDITHLQNQMMDEGYSASSLNHYHHMIRGAFGEDSAQAKAWKRMRDTTQTSGRIRFYTPEQARVLLEHTVLWWERPWYTLAVQAGLRRGEVIGLRRIDVDLAANRIHVVQAYTSEGGMGDTKGHQVRSVPMTSGVRAVLEPLIGDQPLYGDDGTPLLVFSRDGFGTWPMDPDSATKRFERTRKRAGLPRITLHELRHSFATNYMARHPRANAFKLQRLMGHQDITTTQKYMHYQPDDDAEELSAIWEEPTEAEVIPIRKAS